MKTTTIIVKELLDYMKEQGVTIPSNKHDLALLDAIDVDEQLSELMLQIEEHETFEEKIECTDFKIVANDMKMREQKIDQPPNGEIYTIIVKAR